MSRETNVFILLYGLNSASLKTDSLCLRLEKFHVATSYFYYRFQLSLSMFVKFHEVVFKPTLHLVSAIACHIPLIFIENCNEQCSILPLLNKRYEDMKGYVA